MKDSLRKKVNETLSNLAVDMQENMGSVIFWGEVEVPECLRRELEEKQEEE